MAGWASSLVFFYVVNVPKDQQPTESDFLTFVLSIVMIYPPVKSLTRMHNQLHQARAASERVFELLAAEKFRAGTRRAENAPRGQGRHRL